MDNRISDLLSIIRKEISLYRDLVEHARKKTDLLAQGGIEAILESNRAEETFNTEIRFFESERERICNDLRLSFGMGREGFTILKLADNLEQSMALEIKSQAALFRNIVNQLKAVIQHNMRVIENSLRYSQGLLRIISNATSPYQRTGLFRTVPPVQPTFSHRA